MSISRQPNPEIRSVAIAFTQGHRWRKHRSDWGQLIWGYGGMMTVEAGPRLWVVPPQHAMWVAPGVTHTVEMTGRGSSQRLYIKPAWCRALPRTCQLAPLSSLLRELLKRTLQLGTLSRARVRERRVFELLLDEIVCRHTAPIELPSPLDPRARRAADLMRASSQSAGDLATVARHSGASVRTLERLFATETGISLGAWQRRARYLRALTMLASGASVTATGLAVGYASTSAFVAAFRLASGTTPGRYFKRSIDAA